MDFIIYDIALLVIFAIFISVFLYTRRKNLKKEGLLLLYKADWGVKLIERVSKKYKKLWKALSYVSIVLGYILMILMVYFFFKIVSVYLFKPEIVRTIKIPPIMPLIPYLPQVFKLEFLPPFYFIYWIIIIAAIAIPHELAHGIFSAYNKIKIKSTGFGFFPFFLPVFLAAFVEPDEKQMAKKNKFSQMSILSAGTFANILTAIFFLIVLWLFFSIGFAPSGVAFDTYSYSIAGVSSISMVNNITMDNISYTNLMNILKENDTGEVKINNQTFLLSKKLLENPQSKVLFEQEEKILVFNDAPAIKNGLIGAITEIDGVAINSREKLVDELNKKSPGEEIEIETFTGEEYQKKNLTLAEHPEKKGQPLLGIGFLDSESQGILGRISKMLAWFKDPNIYYKPIFECSEFIFNLLWWIILISISVALINMLPIGIFDGGRFFYLTIVAITGREKIAKKVFMGVTFLFLLLLALIMFFWAFNFL